MGSPFDVFRKNVTLLRVGPGVYNSYGDWVDGDTTTSTIVASVQPITPQEMDLVPEARRQDARYSLYGDTLLRAGNEVENVNADRVILPNDSDSTYEVLGADHWQNDIINHYRGVVGVRNDR